MKWVIGSLVALALAVIIWGAWYVNDVKTHRLSFGAGEAIAAEPAKMDSAEVKELMQDRFMGNPDAPVEVIIFSSFSCYHCAVFHKEILPELKKRYADTGKAVIYYHDLAMDTRSAAAGMLARCMDDNEFWKFADIVMANQSKWSMATDYKDILSGYAILGGLAKDKATGSAAERGSIPFLQECDCFIYRSRIFNIKSNAHHLLLNSRSCPEL